MEIKLAPTVQFRLGGTEWRTIELWLGSGSERSHATFEDPTIVDVLLQLRYPARRVAALELVSARLGYTRERADAFLSMLEQRGVLVAADAPNPYATAAARRWIDWGWRDALDYHLAVRDLPFASGDDAGMEAQIAELAQRLDAADAGGDLPSPGPYKDYPAVESIALPRSSALISAADVATALYKRRTCGNLTERVLDLPRFSELVEHSFGCINEMHLGRMGPHLRRTTPSGGARHPVEIYVAVCHVDGIDPGLYHYSTRNHALEQLRRGDLAREIYDLGHRQEGLASASAAFFYTARWDRHMWKYRYARSYRTVLFDIAQLVQTTLVVATALDLRTFLTPALDDAATARFLGIDDLAESPLYVTSVG